LVAPFAATPTKSAQIGRDNKVLFVGSSAAPNVDGLRWFLDTSWPELRRLKPTVELSVVGSVCQSFGNVPEGVMLMGQIKDLHSVYQDAGVVISPLRAGSGLKIKLIEGLSLGKAMVVTSTTMQGVNDWLSDCVVTADDPIEFAKVVSRLLNERTERLKLGERSIQAINKYFSRQTCYEPFVTAVTSHLK
jgi:succinoglycan biosynthesis protein ExoO